MTGRGYMDCRPSSPHPWGCFLGPSVCFPAFFIFPTPVGVFLDLALREYREEYLPHTRGGVSSPSRSRSGKESSSPHPWGCFHSPFERLGDHVIFPTPVGVFLPWNKFFHPKADLPHTRGGVSAPGVLMRLGELSSPHPWGCFHTEGAQRGFHGIFPTPVGVFPDSEGAAFNLLDLPHTRGGVSKKVPYFTTLHKSSPHPWGCFRVRSSIVSLSGIFPTPVGVFPMQDTLTTGSVNLPHTRGGVSRLKCTVPTAGGSSPHPWGCFSFYIHFGSFRFIFPTPVGVFPYSLSFFRDFFHLPHTRGGVSRSHGKACTPPLSSPHPWGCF